MKLFIQTTLQLLLVLLLRISSYGTTMKIIHSVKELETCVQQERQNGKVIGLVPTMGALHAGHASLVERSVKENDITIVSVFVNPTQFNDKNDLLNYPRTLEADCELLEKLGTDVVFAPSVEEVYPEPDTRQFSYPPIDTVMEGERRPGHFNGVCQIVSKLFYMTQPDVAYFGEKDFQQVAVIRAMVADLQLPVRIIPCPIVREPSGLAMSSRNTLLTDSERETALHISKTLFDSVNYAKTHTVAETCQHVVTTLNAIDGLDVEYYQIVDGITLQEVHSWDAANEIVGCITVFCGARPVRLIDNIRYK